MATIKTRWIVGAFALGLIAMHVGPLLPTHSEQDACSFSAVSNEEYRSLLGRASLSRWRPFLRWSDGGVTLQMTRKYRELLPDAPSDAMKVAVAHAVLRALGAEYRRFDDLKSSVPDAKIQRSLRYTYLLDINRLFYFSPLPRNMFIAFSLENPILSATKQDPSSDLRITALLPNILDGIPQVDSDSIPCPPIPPT